MIGSQVLQLSKRNEVELEEGKWDTVREFLDVFLTEENGRGGKSGLMVILTPRLTKSKDFNVLNPSLQTLILEDSEERK